MGAGNRVNVLPSGVYMEVLLDSTAFHRIFSVITQPLPRPLLTVLGMDGTLLLKSHFCGLRLYRL